MLVLSRKASEELCFPSIGITIRVVRVKGSVVQLGIEAPKFVRVLRREVLAQGLLEPIASMAGPSEDHEFRNRLNELVLQIQLAMHAHPGQLSETGIALRKLIGEVTASSLTDANLPEASNGHVSTTRGAAEVVKVLVVDDVANERQLFSSVLQLRGFEVIQAADGAQALEMLSTLKRPPAAVLLDLEMPRVAGEQVLRSIRADIRLSKLKVFAISARSPHEFLLPSSLPGFDAWFAKPLKFDRLIDLLTSLNGGPLRV